MRSASYTPIAAQAAVKRSANVVQDPVAPTRCRSSSRCRSLPVRSVPVNTSPSFTSMWVPLCRSLTIVPSALTQTSPGIAPLLVRSGWAPSSASVRAATPASMRAPSSCTQPWTWPWLTPMARSSSSVRAALA